MVLFLYVFKKLYTIDKYMYIILFVCVYIYAKKENQLIYMYSNRSFV